MRLFVAINFSTTLKQAMAELLVELRQLAPNIKWVPPENIHLTLKFLGEVAPNGVEAMGAALRRAAAGFAPWSLEIKGTGVFPGWRSPRVVWVGVNSAEPLYILQQQLSREYLALGFPLSPFTPHLTLGRLRPGTTLGAVEEKLKGLSDHSWGQEKVTAVSLMESRLTPRGAIYRPVLTVPLPQAEAPQAFPT